MRWRNIDHGTQEEAQKEVLEANREGKASALPAHQELQPSRAADSFSRRQGVSDAGRSSDERSAGSLRLRGGVSRRDAEGDVQNMVSSVEVLDGFVRADDEEVPRSKPRAGSHARR